MSGIDAQLYGVDMLGHSMRPPVSSSVAQKFLVAPFTVLNSREGDWQYRKRAWSGMGINGELGRLGVDQSLPASAKNDYQRLIINSSTGAGVKGGVSIFCPVLCELAYRWWTGEGAQIIDPFAGGSVRGVVASHLGRKYWGCDLRPEQIEANRAQGDALCVGKPPPVWICGDSLREVENAPEADFVFSCPPYGDLEQYSDRPEDLSAMAWTDFLKAYREIINLACVRLRNNRFACFVVGDFRDGRGNYRNFVSETISAFLDAGLNLYNEAILITSVGSAAMRVTRQFEAGRKLCKTHQNVLVFVKGDGRMAADNCKENPTTNLPTNQPRNDR